MFTLGIPNRQYRRATQVLGHESAEPINYNSQKQEDGFYMFSFPGADEFDFKDIVLLLKSNGISTIGADNQLTERKIMKLTDLIKEAPTLEEMKQPKWLLALKNILIQWEVKQYPDDRTKWEMYFEDIKDLVDEWEDELEDEEEEYHLNRPSVPYNLSEDKLREVIRKIIRE